MFFLHICENIFPGIVSTNYTICLEQGNESKV